MHNIEAINKLLKDELAATETYQQALNKLKEDVSLGEAEQLMPIYEDHIVAVASLQTQSRDHGGTADEDAGAWGTWAKLLLGGATILGQQSVLKALHEGEKSGVEDYEEALKDTQLAADLRSLIETKLLPAQKAHVRTLDLLLDAA
ncbi:DUF2383 domain-containing protein [Methylicorpusculum sp.]|uniref:DUF2383 domain-containing protein n=1 Tax=Methylicorpusculum sp. TaxID=2713644 RepID=UPI002723DAE6|nr:DUF2383 domain-containing protein [Methylicorpusculum sp.]MDO8846362.1 DUF2383 domain-containing protein [Methylicorpusculum sp.]MDP2177723.1 DUF2383 domain-containing protein [Methylicorpusculum sp.]MDP3528308.1 DUF2383 domain-containing protein [Methylicorpusculum sp.]MDZ4149506.1 DUF2383 domain-containing protein [Methylicorpusculum sp.]